MVWYEGSAISHAHFTGTHDITGDEILPPKIVVCDAYMVTNKTSVITTLVLTQCRMLRTGFCCRREGL